MDDKIKKIIIIIAVLLVIIIIVLVVSILLLNKNLNSDEVDEDGNNREVEIEYIAENTVNLVENRNEYYTIKSIMESYLLYLSYLEPNLEEINIPNIGNMNEQEVIQEYRKLGIQAIRNMLDSEYLAKNSKTDEQIYQEFKNYANGDVKIQDMYMIEKSDRINIFYINGKDIRANKEFKLAVKTDSLNMTYSIFPEEYITKNGGTQNVIQDISISNIEVNDNNTFNYKNTSSKVIAIDYFNTYKNDMLNDIETAYNKLDEKYRKLRFGSFDAYKAYIQSIYNELEQRNISSYLVNEYEGYKEYVCKDQYDNLYIFKETALMQYTVTLDTYTIEQAKFTQEYENANTQKKVMLNIDKFIQMLNAKDYRNSYLLLSSSFRNTYFKTQQEYETYMKQNVFRYNEVTYSGYETYNDIYTYKLTIKDKTKQSEAVKELNINMKLGEGTNFELSFKV